MSVSDEWDEWGELGQRILEANPEKYKRLLVLLRRLAAAEERLASQDIRLLMALLRTKVPVT